ncbi:MAG: asparagine synthetase B [candidate division KSB1 bacterium]|nr:asparagine synthetase B [candidate division KSB1 bacterium]MDZ7368489.1 asparagine synthetase B [candidate division KSB1 bacterium]MDZ7406215.1 asparagine synthetase B [candidate division KSB1 bacterium]
MPGILGLVQPRMRLEAANRQMQNLIEPLIHFPWYQWAKEHWQGATLGIVSLGALTRVPQCRLSEDERYLLAFEGELYNAGELQKELGLHGLQGEAAEIQSEVVLHAMIRWGAEALKRFNGLFQLALWDAHQQEIIVAGDRGGLRPIYFVQQKENFAFAPEVKALLTLPWVSREIDHYGILSFLRHGLPLGMHTFFEEVNVLPAGSFAIFRQGRLRVERYWQMNFQEAAPRREKEIQQRFVETWKDVMQSQTRGDFRLGLPLSGGVDSRLILSALMANQQDVLTFTMGNPGCRDAEIAQRLAEIAGYPNLFSPIVANETAMDMERSVYLTDGMFNCFHANIRRLLPSLVESVNMVYDGITPLDSLYDPEDLFWRRFLRQTDPAHWLRAEVNSANIRDFALGSSMRVDLIDEEAQPLFQHDFDFIDEFVWAPCQKPNTSPALVDRFWLEEFQHRFSAFGPQILRTAVEVRCPFFDNRMLDLIGELTPMQRSSDKPLQRHTINALTPALARIPWERTGLPLTAGFGKTQLRRAANVLRRQAYHFMSRQKPAPAHKMIDYDEMIRTSPELQQKIASILIDRWPQGSRLFNRHSLQMLLEEHVSRTGNFAEMIGRILTVEIWHKLFVRDAARQPRVMTQTPQRVYRMAA